MGCELTLVGVDDSLTKILLPLLKSDRLFELLKHNTKDALGKGVTQKEKSSMINQDAPKSRRIILQPWKKDFVTDDVRSELRIYVQNISPENRYVGNITFGFDIVIHDSIWQLNGGKQRAILIAQELYKILNANEVEFIGKLEAGFGNGMNIVDYGNNFTGYHLSFSSGVE